MNISHHKNNRNPPKTHFGPTASKLSTKQFSLQSQSVAWYSNGNNLLNFICKLNGNSCGIFPQALLRSLNALQTKNNVSLRKEKKPNRKQVVVLEASVRWEARPVILVQKHLYQVERVGWDHGHAEDGAWPVGSLLLAPERSTHLGPQIGPSSFWCMRPMLPSLYSRNDRWFFLYLAAIRRLICRIQCKQGVEGRRKNNGGNK